MRRQEEKRKRSGSKEGIMSSGCISSSGCVDARAPVRATYVNLYKWPESDAEFVRSSVGGGGRPRPRVVDSYSCRQMYLRSYTFSRKESVPERTMRCLGKVRDLPLFFNHGERLESSGRDKKKRKRKKRKRKENKKKKKGCVMARKLQEVSYSALCSIFHRLLSCTTSVEMV